MEHLGYSEALARRVRIAAGKFNDDDKPVTHVVELMGERIRELESQASDLEFEEALSWAKLVSDLREEISSQDAEIMRLNDVVKSWMRKDVKLREELSDKCAEIKRGEEERKLLWEGIKNDWGIHGPLGAKETADDDGV